jgi:predicted adenylyl cyclase CyaB
MHTKNQGHSEKKPTRLIPAPVQTTDTKTTPQGEPKLKSKLIELKATLRSLTTARDKINAMGARKQGTYRQVDMYFNVHTGRLKLREVEREPTSMLIYYDREDIPDLKESDIIILETDDPESLKAILRRSLGIMVIVTKQREIYHHEGTQIHLDRVDDLGTFIEFERPITDLPEDRKNLEELMEKLTIEPGDLITGSYSDLKTNREQ